MLLSMTLSGRNIFFRGGIAFCAISALLVLYVSFLVVPSYSEMGENARRPGNFFQVLLGNFFNADYMAVHATLVMVVFFSLIALCLILAFFEQTQAPEILYIAIFTLSFSFEAIRLALPLGQMYNIPSFYLLLASRVLLFARYFGIFSLFTASLCAAGFEIQLTRNVITVLIVSTLAITIGVPIDSHSWDTSLNMIYGFNTMFMWIDIIAFFSTVISFFIAVNVRGSKEYAYIGTGLLMAFAGRYLLLYIDNWAGPIPGIIMLSFGTWFVCSRLHKIYLWL
jgi:hypothetical protein